MWTARAVGIGRGCFHAVLLQQQELLVVISVAEDHARTHAQMPSHTVPCLRRLPDREKTEEQSIPPVSPSWALFQLSNTLQRQLLDDWVAVRKENQLVLILRDLTVEGVLHRWVNNKRQLAEKATKEVADGLEVFFNVTLEKLLLYWFERKKYDQYFADENAQELRNIRDVNNGDANVQGGDADEGEETGVRLSATTQTTAMSWREAKVATE